MGGVDRARLVSQGGRAGHAWWAGGGKHLVFFVAVPMGKIVIKLTHTRSFMLMANRN